MFCSSELLKQGHSWKPCSKPSAASQDSSDVLFIFQSEVAGSRICWLVVIARYERLYRRNDLVFSWCDCLNFLLINMMSKQNVPKLRHNSPDATAKAALNLGEQFGHKIVYFSYDREVRPRQNLYITTTVFLACPAATAKSALNVGGQFGHQIVNF